MSVQCVSLLQLLGFVPKHVLHNHGPSHNGSPVACHVSWWMTVAAPAHPDQGDEGVLVRQLGRQAHGAQDQEDPRRPRVCLQIRGVVLWRGDP